MPIFMDRHDLPESVTAEEVARLHQEDLKIEHKFGCKGMTYWFDEVRNTAFCLIQAPNKQALQEMHNQAHGAVANRIIEVEPSIVESFLGRIEDPVKAQNTELNIINDPAFRILMVARFNPLISKGDNGYIRPVKTFIDINHEGNENRFDSDSIGSDNSTFESFAKIVEEFGGTLVQSTSTKKLVSFRFAASAVNCAQCITKAYGPVNTTLVEPHEVKLGLSSGLPFEEDEGLFKETIKYADRLCDAVEGRIVITSDLSHLYESENQNKGLHENSIRVVSAPEERFLNALMDFLEKSYARTDLKVEHFSSNLGLSKAQLYRKVKNLTGKSLNTFVKDYRLEMALSMLLKKQANISEVAFDTGFNSPAYFSKCFSKAYNILPSRLVR